MFYHPECVISSAFHLIILLFCDNNNNNNNNNVCVCVYIYIILYYIILLVNCTKLTKSEIKINKN